MDNTAGLCLKPNMVKNNLIKNGENYVQEIDFKLYITKESIGEISIYKCLQCPYMSFSIKDMKHHVGILHVTCENNKKDNILMKCPGCPGQFFTETYLKTHLHSHHKMLAKDISKLILNNMKDIKNGHNTLLNFDTVDNKSSLPFYNDPVHFNEIDTDFSQMTRCYETNYNQNNNQSEMSSNIDNNFSDFKSNHDQVNQELFSDIEILEDSQNNPTVCENIKLMEPAKLTDFQNADTFHNVGSQNEVLPNNKFNETQIQILKYGNSSTEPNCNLIFQKKSSNTVCINKKGYKCNIQNCRVRLNSLKNISYHKSCHLNNTKNLSCPECKNHFATIGELHTHLWRLHQIDLELHTCNHCPYKSYSRNRLINIHMKIHSDERNYPCKICLKTFKNSKQLANHSATHKKKENLAKKIFCDLCKREFSTKTLLSVHEKSVHKKIKQFSCERCDYSTSLKSSLILHMRSHTGEKPYHCSECNFKSPNRGTLKRHLMTHSQQKRYKCDNCSYSCIQASSIKAHVKLKHPGIKSNLLYSCSHCSYTTVNKANYSAHGFTHSVNNDTNKKLTTENSEKEIKYGNGKKISNQVNKKLTDPQMMIEDVSQNVSDERSLLDKQFLNDNSSSYPKKQAIEETELMPNNNPIYVKNIIDLTSNSIRLNNAIFKNLAVDVHQGNTKNPILSIVRDENIAQNWSDASISHHDSNINGNINEIMPDILYNNDVLINNKSITENAISRKKPKISVKSNLILKGPDSVHPFNSQSSFSELRNLPEIFLPQHLIFNDDHTNQNNETGSEQTSFDNNGNNESMGLDFHHISYDSFHHSEYSLQNFQSPTMSMDAMHSDITQYILNENVEFLNKDDNHQLSVEMKGENNSNPLLKVDLVELNSNDTYSAKNIQYSDNKSYLTLIQPSIKCEDKVNTEYFTKNIMSEEIDTFPSNADHLPVIEELPIIFYEAENNEAIQNYSTGGNDIIMIDETSCDTKSLMSSGIDLKLNFIQEN